ncbi:aminodeoxychorismate/anthranilate synthase component II [Alteromonas sp. 5E99-2]|uniref:anthranilate synthase component II n=1 Tax=Alteromonas sp. 5E99-2 TaxID=2817683 RepID=UPI001A99D85C|nr:aminodeoxychorismate/anthranilate synthase component II [Alteromonas sp. 5E99-2]MBO1255435.1 aminodeoxychorismate/anthranilate synthase component II [Alteromonas sp. 5E99-2]
MTKLAVVLLDNVDSFTYNLVDELERVSDFVSVFRNTLNVQTVLDAIAEKQKNHQVVVVLSPGPGEPQNAGCMPELLTQIAGSIPVLGICLGHQAIVEHYGGSVGRAPVVMHGKASLLPHNESGVFSELPNPLPIARYHSLVAQKLPDSLQKLASIGDQVMAIWHPQDKMMGFQFHPESILTTAGSQLLANTLNYLTLGDA